MENLTAEHIPIVLGIENPCAPNVNYWKLLSSGNGSSLKHYRDAVLRRDFHTCGFCGFRSEKYQEVIARQGADWDNDALVTACIFCAQCMTLERVTAMRSGVLLWLPEMPQSHLNRLAAVIYICRISQGSKAEKARKILDLLMARRDVVRSQIGFDDPFQLAKQMQSCSTPETFYTLRNRINGVRLFPLDRRIIKEADLEFNQFPQILAYWRSKNGPFRRDAKNIPLLDYLEPVLDGFLERGFGPLKDCQMIG